MALSTDEIIAAADDWRAWGRSFGWTLTGVGDTFHDERGSAGFRREGERDTFTITRQMRDDIDNRKRTN